MTATCSAPSCGARILWTLTAAGKQMPVDAEPTPAGTLVLEPLTGAAAAGRVTHSSHVENLLDDAGDRYVSHFATCPAAADFRRPRHPR